MPIKLVKEGTALGVGGLAVLTRFVDERQGWVIPPRRTQDVLGIGGHALGLIMWHLTPEEGVMGDVAEACALSTAPLAVISVYEIVKHYLKRGSPSGAKTAKEAGYRLRQVRKGVAPVAGVPSAAGITHGL